MEIENGHYSFWEINHSLDTKQVGRTFPQIQTSGTGNYFSDGRVGSVRNLQSNRIPEEDDIDFGILAMRKSSKPSDLISSSFMSSSGLFLSPFALEIFQQFNLGVHKYFSATVLHKETYHTYYYLQLNNDFNPHIDFDKSKFTHITRSINRVKINLEVNSIRHLRQLQEKVISDCAELHLLTHIEFDKIVFNRNIPDIDIFNLSRLESKLYITSRLKEAIVKSRLTGFNIIAQTKMQF